MTNEILIACVRVRDIANPIKGCVILECHRCLEHVYLTPVTAETVRTHWEKK